MARPLLGVLMLDTRFPRMPGDIGCEQTFAFPVRRRVVAGAFPKRIVVDADRGLLAPFLAAARALETEGCTAIATSCGFLALFQRELQAACGVPVWSSSLLLVADLQAGLPPDRRVGILTADTLSLTAAHLAAAGAPVDTPIEGLAADSAFHRTLIENLPTLDSDEAEAATVSAARRLLQRRPEVAALVLECTNMPPHADAVRAATGLAVHDITTLIEARFGATTR